MRDKSLGEESCRLSLERGLRLVSTAKVEPAVADLSRARAAVPELAPQLAVACLDICGRFWQITSITPSEPAAAAMEAGVEPINGDNRDRAAASVDGAWVNRHVLAQDGIVDSLFGAISESLASSGASRNATWISSCVFPELYSVIESPSRTPTQRPLIIKALAARGAGQQHEQRY